MLLAIDIGNSHTVVGVFDQELLLNTYRLSTRLDETTDDLKLRFRGILALENYECALITGVVISSVVPPLDPAYNLMSASLFECVPCWIKPGKYFLDMPIKIDKEEELGADRLVNAIAVYIKYGGPVIIVDLGTAITFCLVSREGEYMGGSITTGVSLSLDALHKHTSKLPVIDFDKPSQLVGKNTRDGILSGVYFGTVCMIEGMIERFKQEPGFEEAKVIATGGLAVKIASDCHRIDRVDEHLTLEGLQFIYQKIKTPKRWT